MTQFTAGNDSADRPLQTPGGKHAGFQPTDHGDEISLYDIWLILARRWPLVLTLFAVVSLTTVAIAMALPKRYMFTTLLEIGQVSSGADAHMLEPPEVIRLRLEKSIIPRIRREIDGAEVSSAPQIKVDIIAGQDVIAISSAAPMRTQKKVQTVHAAIADALVALHSPRFEREVNALLLPLRNSVSTLTEQEQDLQRQLVHVTELSEASIGKKPEQDFLLSVRLTDLRRELTQLRARLADHKREIDSIRLASRNTSVVEMASQADRSLGPSRGLIVALGGMLGLLVGVIAAFAADFLSQARQATQSGVR